MEKIYAALEELREINQSYELSVQEIDQLQENMRSAKVCTPFIGRFSSGKSALVNTLLGYSKGLLKEDITPETAFPAEIVYTPLNEKVTVTYMDGREKDISVDDYLSFEADADKVKKVRLQLHNEHFLGDIPDVMLVDMPGFESGFEVHNRAIDNYLPQSLAYIITFPADDMIVRQSIGNILKELFLYDKPICVVITKCDKQGDDFEYTLDHLKRSLRKYIGDKKITYCLTCSRTGDAEELEAFLRQIQAEAQDILAAKYKKLALPLAESTKNYLATLTKGSQFSASELDEKKEKLQHQLTNLDSSLSQEQQTFEKEASACIEIIKTDIENALEDAETTFVALTLDQKDINGQLNQVVRTAAAKSIQKRFVPVMKKYMNRVQKVLSSGDFGEVATSFTFDADKYNSASDGLLGAIAAGAVGAAGTGTMSFFGAGLVLSAPVLAVLAGLAALVTMKLFGSKKEKAKQEIRQRLEEEVFPQVMNQVGLNIEKTIMEQVQMASTTIAEDFGRQKETLEKAMADLHQQMDAEKTEKENLAERIKTALEQIEVIEDELR